MPLSDRDFLRALAQGEPLSQQAPLRRTQLFLETVGQVLSGGEFVPRLPATNGLSASEWRTRQQGSVAFVQNPTDAPVTGGVFPGLSAITLEPGDVFPWVHDFPIGPSATYLSAYAGLVKCDARLLTAHIRPDPFVGARVFVWGEPGETRTVVLFGSKGGEEIAVTFSDRPQVYEAAESQVVAIPESLADDVYLARRSARLARSHDDRPRLASLARRNPRKTIRLARSRDSQRLALDNREHSQCNRRAPRRLLGRVVGQWRSLKTRRPHAGRRRELPAPSRRNAHRRRPATRPRRRVLPSGAEPMAQRDDVIVRSLLPEPWKSTPVWEIDHHLYGTHPNAVGKYAGELPKLAWLSTYSSGYVREKAIRFLAEIDSGEELPFLLLRLNDWVEPIRTRARNAVGARLTPEYAERFVTHLRLVESAARGGRDDHAWLRKQVLELLLHPECRGVLERGIHASDPFVRRTCWLQLLATRTYGDGLWEDALDRPEVSGDAARTLAEKLPEFELAALTRRRLNRKPAALTALLLARLAERSPSLAEPILRDALLAEAPTLRRYARFYLNDLDAAAFYRDALTERPTPGAILGLGETGNAHDIALIAPFLESQPAAALSALARLDFDAALPRLLDALGSPTAGLRRVAREALLEKPLAAEERAEAFAFDPAQEPLVRKGAFAILRALPHHRKIAYLVRAMGDPFWAESADDNFDAWLRRDRHVFTKPTAHEADALRTALERSPELAARLNLAG